MRFLLVTFLVLGLSTSTGCMVLDEVDKANAQMKSKARKTGQAKTATAASSGSADEAALEKARALLEPSLEWWESASSFSAQEVDASVVRCDVGGSVQFMSRDDCRVRGGVPGGV
jgi:hypothetical protein